MASNTVHSNRYHKLFFYKENVFHWKLKWLKNEILPRVTKCYVAAVELENSVFQL